jgi:transposase
MTGLNTHLAPLDDDLDTSLRASPIGREHEALLRSVPGIGPVWTRTLRLDLPELGTVSRQRLAALVGVAPGIETAGPCGASGRLGAVAPMSGPP